MEKQQFKKLQIGDLVEWNNKFTLDTNKLGIVVKTTTFSTTLCGNGTTQDNSCYQARVKWKSHEYAIVYTENDDRSIDLMKLIAAAKKI